MSENTLQNQQKKEKVNFNEVSIASEIQKLWLDSRFGKDKHFAAANRTKRLHYWLGIPTIIISVFLGSVFFGEVWQDIKLERFIGAALAMLSALLVSLQTFMNPKEIEEGHRSVGNKYLEISRNCRLVSAKLNDKLIKIECASIEYEELLTQYNETNRAAEAFPVKNSDFNHAKEMAETKVT